MLLASLGRLKVIVNGRRIEGEIDEEMRLHLDLLAEEYEQNGMTRKEAIQLRVADSVAHF
jgi:hypothetical protein